MTTTSFSLKESRSVPSAGLGALEVGSRGGGHGGAKEGSSGSVLRAPRASSCLAPLPHLPGCLLMATGGPDSNSFCRAQAKSDIFRDLSVASATSTQRCPSFIPSKLSILFHHRTFHIYNRTFISLQGFFLVGLPYTISPTKAGTTPAFFTALSRAPSTGSRVIHVAEAE